MVSRQNYCKPRGTSFSTPQGNSDEWTIGLLRSISALTKYGNCILDAAITSLTGGLIRITSQSRQLFFISTRPGGFLFATMNSITYFANI